ncbi:beta strand repeat-containing protein [Hymenobacter ruber]
MKQFFTTRLLSCLAVLGLTGPTLAVQAQALTQADFTGVVVPQYLSNGNNSGTATFPGPRLAVAFRATVSNLTASTTYRYYVQAATQSEFTGTASGAGVVLSATPGTTPATSTYATSSTGSLGTAGSYASFTTDASGSYTGWFFFVNSNNATRFQTPGTVLFPTITLATDAVPGTIVARRALNQSITLLGFLPSAGANNGTLLTGSSSATPNNVVFTYDNTAGTGRPLSGAVVESIGVTTGTTQTGANAYTYSTTNGSYTTVIPNTLATGVRRVEERSIVSGAVLNCNSDADGIWPSGANTVNPAGGTAAVVLTATDTPLNAGCNSAATATITGTPASLTAFTTVVGTPSATQTITVGGTSLTADIVVTAPAGYEVSLSATTGFAATVTVPQTSGTAANTPVYVRLTGAATGTFAGNVALNSTGATSVNVNVTGTVTAVATPAPTITSFTPTTGAAGTTVTITGTNLTGATAVTLNGVAITGFTVVNGTTITFTLPAAATTGTIAVTTPGGTVTSTGTFTVTASAPTITSFTPTTGTAGTTVTLTGTNFTGATTVTVGGITVTGFTVVNATTITFVLPATAVTGPIVVTTPAGTATSTTSFTVTVAAVPTITTLSPARAVVGGPAFVLTVGGTNLTATTQVNFRGQNYTAATVTGTTSITVNIPASAIATVGQFTVTVNNGGTASNTLDFAVVAAATTVAYEDFEQGVRTGYTDAAPVALRSGAWTFTQALLGDLFNDRVNQTKSARIRGGGSIAMNFDKPNGAGIVTISAGLYGSDTGPTFTAEVSTDGGTTYQTIAGTPATLTSTLTPYTLTVNRSGNVRLRFSTTNATAGQNPRINLDDLNITNFTGTATAASQALPGLSVFPNPATDRITVALPSAGAATVALRDLTGRVVLAPATLGADKQLVLPASLARGVYMLEVKQGDVLAVRRIEKN